MRFIKAIIFIFFFAFAIIFVIQNKDSFMLALNLKFDVISWNWSCSIPVYTTLVISFLIGALLMWLYLVSEVLKKNKELKLYQQRIEELEEELASYQEEFEEYQDQEEKK